MSMKLKCALLLVLALASAGCAKKVDVTASKAALQTADAEWSKSVATGADAFMGFVAQDGVIMPPNEPAVSGPAAHDWAAKMIATPGFGVTWSANVVEVAGSGDVGYTSGRYDLHASAPDGSPFSDHGKYLTVWKKDTTGAWKVVLDTFNSDVAMAGAGAAIDSTANDK